MEIDKYIDDLCINSRRKNLFYLQNRSYNLDKIRIIGTTLWSHIPVSAQHEIDTRVKDYRNIHLPVNLRHVDWSCIQPRNTNSWHKTAVDFIKQELKDAAQDQKCIVLTHHAPLTRGTCAPRYENDSIQSAFSTPLDNLFKEYVTLHQWAFGHTHWACDFKFHQTRLISNPGASQNFNKAFSIEL